MAKMMGNRGGWILATNPGNNNQCRCFLNIVPNGQWVQVNKYKTSNICEQFVAKCHAFFSKQNPGTLVEIHNGMQRVVPKVKRKFRMMGMGMMG